MEIQIYLNWHCHLNFFLFNFPNLIRMNWKCKIELCSFGLQNISCTLNILFGWIGDDDCLCILFENILWRKWKKFSKYDEHFSIQYGFLFNVVNQRKIFDNCVLHNVFCRESFFSGNNYFVSMWPPYFLVTILELSSQLI